MPPALRSGVLGSGFSAARSNGGVRCSGLAVGGAFGVAAGTVVEWGAYPRQGVAARLCLACILLHLHLHPPRGADGVGKDLAGRILLRSSLNTSRRIHAMPGGFWAFFAACIDLDE